VKLIAHFHPVPRFRKSGTLPLIPYIPSWRGQGKLYVLPSILILSCNIHYGFESGRYPTAATYQYNTQTPHYMHCQPQTHREIKAAKLKPLQENVAEIMWMRKYELYTRNARSKAFTAAQHLAYYPCCTSSKWFRRSRRCLCTYNQNVIGLADSCQIGRYTLSTGEQQMRRNCACIFRITQSFECRQLYTSRNGSAARKT